MIAPSRVEPSDVGQKRGPVSDTKGEISDVTESPTPRRGGKQRPVGQESKVIGFEVHVLANIGARIDPEYPGEKVGNGVGVKRGDTVRCTEVVSFPYRGTDIFFYKLLDGEGWIHDFAPDRPVRTISRGSDPALGESGPPSGVGTSQSNVTDGRSLANASMSGRETAFLNRNKDAWALLMSRVRDRSKRGLPKSARTVAEAMVPPPPRPDVSRWGKRAEGGDGKRVGPHATRDNRRGDDVEGTEVPSYSPVANRTRTRKGEKSKKRKGRKKSAREMATGETGRSPSHGSGRGPVGSTRNAGGGESRGDSLQDGYGTESGYDHGQSDHGQGHDGNADVRGTRRPAHGR